MRSLAFIVLLGGLSLAPSAANATIFNVWATVGGNQTTTLPGPPTGLTLTGTVDINTITGTLDSLSLTLAGDPNVFTGSFGCPSDCTFYFNSGFDEFGLLDLTGGSSLVGYNGGSLLADSYIDTSSIAYNLTGTVTPADAATPEPSLYGVVALGLGGLFTALRRRKRQEN